MMYNVSSGVRIHKIQLPIGGLRRRDLTSIVQRDVTVIKMDEAQSRPVWIMCYICRSQVVGDGLQLPMR